MTVPESPARVSQRAQGVPWSPIRHMMGLAAKMPGVISFAVGQPDYDTPKHIVDACKAALDAGHTRYGPALGIPELRQAVARKLWRVNGIQADPDTQVIITVGAQEAIMLAMLVLLDPGDEVIMQDPIYTNYHGHVPLVNAKPVLVPAREENGFMMAAEDIEAAITDRTRVLLFNSPCNPTGAVASLPVLESYAWRDLRGAPGGLLRLRQRLCVRPLLKGPGHASFGESCSGNRARHRLRAGRRGIPATVLWLSVHGKPGGGHAADSQGAEHDSAAQRIDGMWRGPKSKRATTLVMRGYDDIALWPTARCRWMACP